MRCQHCGLLNGEDDHRCLHCGRRITGTVIAAPYIGATALAVESVVETEAAPVRAQSPEQPPLFQPLAQPSPQTPKQKVISFEEVQRQAAERFGPQQPIVVAPQTPEAPATRKPAAQPKVSSKKSAQTHRLLKPARPLTR